MWDPFQYVPYPLQVVLVLCMTLLVMDKYIPQVLRKKATVNPGVTPEYLNSVLEEPKLRKQLLDIALKQLNNENIEFILEYRRLDKAGTFDIEQGKKLYDTYIEGEGDRVLNLTAAEKKELKAAYLRDQLTLQLFKPVYNIAFDAVRMHNLMEMIRESQQHIG
jgi:hypothetical protein